MLKLSFILPCYNVAPYVGRCIESIEHQDIPREEYEVICVDDCSTDNTVDVIREYQKQYPNIQLICHEVNKTAGGARNTGMDAAKGEYLWFVDPDDAIISDKSKILYEHAKKHDVDILVFNYLNVPDYGRVSEWTEVLAGQDFFLRYFPDKRMAGVVSVWRQLYKRSFCIENGIHYPEIKSSQDVVFAWNAFLIAKRMCAVPIFAYQCYGRPQSTTGSKGKYKAINAISGSLLFAYEILELLQIKPLEKQFESDIVFAIQDSINNDSRIALMMPFKEKRLFYSKMQKYKEKIDTVQQYMNRKTKMIFNYRLPYIVWQAMIYGYMIVGKSKKV